MTHLTSVMRKEGNKEFIYFGENYPKKTVFQIYPTQLKLWLSSCEQKGNRVEVAKEQEESFLNFIWNKSIVADSWDLVDKLPEGIVIPECYEVREICCLMLTELGECDCVINRLSHWGCKNRQKFAYFKSPEPERSQEREEIISRHTDRIFNLKSYGSQTLRDRLIEFGNEYASLVNRGPERSQERAEKYRYWRKERYNLLREIEDLKKQIASLVSKDAEDSRADKTPTIEIECFDSGETALVKSNEVEWIASWKLFPGMVVSAQTKEQVIDELMTSIRVQLLYEFNKKH